MESSPKRCDKEYMKMAMLKHEETFREQVSELHRLYRIQKMLMKDMKGKASKKQDLSEPPNKRTPKPANHNCQPRGRALDLERPAEDYIEDGNCEEPAIGAEEESEIELTLATGSRTRKKKENSFTSDSGTSLSSSSSESGGENLKFHGWGLLQKPGTGKLSVDGTVREDRLEQPPWLFQCLSLNMT